MLLMFCPWNHCWDKSYRDLLFCLLLQLLHFGVLWLSLWLHFGWPLCGIKPCVLLLFVGKCLLQPSLEKRWSRFSGPGFTTVLSLLFCGSTCLYVRTVLLISIAFLISKSEHAMSPVVFFLKSILTILWVHMNSRIFFWISVFSLGFWLKWCWICRYPWGV